MSRTTRSSAIRPLSLAVFAAVSALSAGQAFAGKANLTGLQSEQSFDQFIVKYRDGSQERRDVNAINRGLDRAARAVVSTRSAKGAGTVSTSVKHLRRMSLGADVVRVGRKLDRVDAETLMRQLASDPNVEYVEVNARMYPLLEPNDTNYANQWGYFDVDAGINAQAAWDVTTGAGVTVAVLDTGITNHADLNANIVAGYDFVSDAASARDGNGRDADPADEGDWYLAGECNAANGSNSGWHGSHVAGTVGAVGNNARGVAGTAYGARIMPVRVLAKCGGSLADIADAITWASGGAVAGVPALAAANVAKIINMSLGGNGACGEIYQAAINGAVARGTTVIVAAGNSANNVVNNRPANCNNVVTVAATDRNGERSIWRAGVSESSYGAAVDIAAPGSDIYSTVNTGATVPVAAGYANKSGTSMATPHVAGVAALVQSRRVARGLALYTPAELEALLKNTARPFPIAPAAGRLIGTGIVDANAAVTAAGGGAGVQAYTNSADYRINDNATVSSPINVLGRNGNGLAETRVAVNIVHTFKGDLKVDLVAPDGSVFVLHDRAGGDADNIVADYRVNLSAEALNGTWNLRVNDNQRQDTGYINSWSITF